MLFAIYDLGLYLIIIQEVKEMMFNLVNAYQEGEEIIF